LSTQNSFNFVGFYNYINAFRDQRFINSILISFYLSIIPTLLQMLLGFIISLALYEISKFKEFFKSIFLIPMVIPPIVVGLVWKMLFIPGSGGINYLLGLIGIRGPDWLNSSITALYSIIIASVWEWTAFVSLLLLAALESLPKDPLESAKIDGATYWQTVKFIMLPMIKNAIMVVFLFRVIEGFRVTFPLIFMMTQGGPGSSTETMDFYSYLQGFNYFKIGYSSTIIAIIFMLLVISIWLPYIKYSKKGEGGIN
jgi:multiple sugar transport system permease protein